MEGDDEEDEEQRAFNAAHVWMVADLDEDGDVDDTYDDLEDVAGVVAWANELASVHQIAHALGIDWRLERRNRNSSLWR